MMSSTRRSAVTKPRISAVSSMARGKREEARREAGSERQERGAAAEAGGECPLEDEEHGRRGHVAAIGEDGALVVEIALAEFEGPLDRLDDAGAARMADKPGEVIAGKPAVA